MGSLDDVMNDLDALLVDVDAPPARAPEGGQVRTRPRDAARYGQGESHYKGQPSLRAGQLVQFEPDGDLFQIVRVTPGAAYRKRAVQKTFVALDRKTGEDKEVSTTSYIVEAVSRYSFVHRVVEEHTNTDV